MKNMVLENDKLIDFVYEKDFIIFCLKFFNDV